MLKGVILIIVGLVAPFVLIFASYRSKSVGVRVVFWTAFLATEAIVLYSGIQNIRSDQDLRRLQVRIKPRHLADRAKFIAFLKEYRRGPVEVRCSGADLEARNFALEINSALKEAGWDSRLNDNVMLFPQPVGLIFWIHSVDSIPDHAGSLQQAFKTIDIPTKVETYDNVGKGTFVLVVGSKKP
jgi:hypothetical protein